MPHFALAVYRISFNIKKSVMNLLINIIDDHREVRDEGTDIECDLEQVTQGYITIEVNFPELNPIVASNPEDNCSAKHGQIIRPGQIENS
jgi:hypothetical protein